MAKAQTAVFEITEGDDWDLDGQFKKNGIPVNLTGSIITSSIRRGPANRFPDLLVSPLCTIAPGTNGEFTISLTRAQTKDLGPGNFLGEVSAQIAGKRFTPLRFKLVVVAEVDVRA